MKYSLMINKINNKLKKFKEKYSYLIKPLIIIFFIYLLAIYPIVRVNFNFNDDLGRTFFGHRQFYYYSRFTSEILSILVHTSTYLTDIAPLTQIIAIILISLSCIVILKIFNKNKKIGIFNIISVIPLGLMPYFLECLTYKFDSPYMALSVFASILPFWFYGKNKKDKIIFSISLLLGTLIMCTTYQASSGIVLLVALFLAFKFWNDGDTKEAIRLLILSFISYLAGLLIFKIIILKPVTSELAYATTQLLPINEIIPGFFGNIINYYKLIISDFQNVWLVLIAIAIVCFIFNSTRYSKQNKIVSFFLSLFLIFASSILAFGVYPALTKTIFAPRAMYGVGVLIALIGVNATKYECTPISKIVLTILCYCFITFSFTFGDVLYEHQRYLDFRIQSVINELNEMDIMNNDDTKYICFDGNVGKSPVFDNMPEKYKNILNRLIIQTFGYSDNGYMYSLYYFYYYFDIKNIKLADPIKSTYPDDLEMYRDTMYFSIETNNKNFILIKLK